MESLCRNRDCGLVEGPRGYRLDGKPFVVPQEDGDLVVVLGGIQLNHTVAANVLHVNNSELEALNQLGEHEACAVHGVCEGEEDGEVIGAGAALVGGKDTEGLGGAHLVSLDELVVELHLGDRGARAPDVAGRGVDQKVLSSTVHARFLGYPGRTDKGVPCELVDVRVVCASGVGHHYRDIVSRVGDEPINNEALASGLPYVGADRFQHAFRGFGVPADGAYVRLNNR